MWLVWAGHGCRNELAGRFITDLLIDQVILNDEDMQGISTLRVSNDWIRVCLLSRADRMNTFWIGERGNCFRSRTMLCVSVGISL